MAKDERSVYEGGATRRYLKVKQKDWRLEDDPMAEADIRGGLAMMQAAGRVSLLGLRGESTVAATAAHQGWGRLIPTLGRSVLTNTRRVDLLRPNCGPTWADERPAPRRESATVLCNML